MSFEYPEIVKAKLIENYLDMKAYPRKNNIEVWFSLYFVYGKQVYR